MRTRSNLARRNRRQSMPRRRQRRRNLTTRSRRKRREIPLLSSPSHSTNARTMAIDQAVNTYWCKPQPFPFFYVNLIPLASICFTTKSRNKTVPFTASSPSNSVTPPPRIIDRSSRISGHFSHNGPFERLKRNIKRRIPTLPSLLKHNRNRTACKENTPKTSDKNSHSHNPHGQLTLWKPTLYTQAPKVK